MPEANISAAGHALSAARSAPANERVEWPTPLRRHFTLPTVVNYLLVLEGIIIVALLFSPFSILPSFASPHVVVLFLVIRTIRSLFLIPLSISSHQIPSSLFPQWVRTISLPLSTLILPPMPPTQRPPTRARARLSRNLLRLRM